MLKLAVTKLIYNQDNVLDNLKISDTDNNSSYYYKTTTGVRCFFEEALEDDGDYYTLIYDNVATAGTSDVVKCKWKNDDYSNLKKFKKEYYAENAFDVALLDTSIYYFASLMLELKCEDIIKCEIANDNYVITFLYDYKEEDGDEVSKTCVKLIINKGFLITKYINEECCFVNNDLYHHMSKSEVIFEYNKIVDSDIISYLNHVKNAEFTPVEQ